MNAISIRNKNYLLKKKGSVLNECHWHPSQKLPEQKNEFGFVMNIINIRQQKLPSF